MAGPVNWVCSYTIDHRKGLGRLHWSAQLCTQVQCGLFDDTLDPCKSNDLHGGCDGDDDTTSILRPLLLNDLQGCFSPVTDVCFTSLAPFGSSFGMQQMGTKLSEWQSSGLAQQQAEPKNYQVCLNTQKPHETSGHRRHRPSSVEV